MMINNSDLMPKWKPDREVKLEDGMCDWIKDLIMAEITPHLHKGAHVGRCCGKT